MTEMRQWLEQLGLGKYAEVFADNDVDFRALSALTEDDLKDLGLTLGHRRVLQQAIVRLGDQTATSGASFDEGSTETVAQIGEAERRQLTVLFADLVGSTELSQHLDPEDLREVNRAYQTAATDAIEQFGGYVARYMGDGILAYFGFPQAHEDDAERAVRAGLEVIAAMDALNDRVGPQMQLQPKVRIGIETGPVIVGDVIGQGASQESPVVGETPNLAARLQGIAEPNCVVAGPHLWALVRDSVSFEALGPHSMKGFAEPIPAWRVTGVRSGVGRFERSLRTGLSRFVGRSAELELLTDGWSHARDGEFVLMHVSGEAGIGKSRLVHEFMRGVRPDAKILEGYCVSHGSKTTYLPFLDMLKRAFAIRDGFDAKERSISVRWAVERLGLEDEPHLPYLLRLLGVPVPELLDIGPDVIGIRTQDALLAVISAYGRVSPTVVFVNDLHWMDRSSEAILQALAVSERPSGVLALCTFRPEYMPSWSGSSTLTTLPLGPLSGSESTLLFRHILRDTVLGDDILREVLERSAGNPLYAEELARHVTHGFDRRVGTLAASHEHASSVPETLSGLLLQRVDRLTPDARHLLQAASVVGRRFSAALVSEFAQADYPAAALAELEQQDLVLPDTSPGRADRRFKHALVQDAVYESLLRSQRKVLHKAAGTRMEEAHRGRESEVAEELTRHFTAAGCWREAASYAAMAGDNAHGLFAIPDARAWYSQALQLMSENPEQTDDQRFARTLVNQLEVICFDADFQGMVELAERHLSHVQSLGEVAQVSRALSWLGEAYLLSSRFEDARIMLKRALGIGERLEDIECVSYAAGDLMWLQALDPDSEETSVESLSDRVTEAAGKHDIPYLNTLSYYTRAVDLGHRGQIEHAHEWASKLIAFGQETAYPPALTWGRSIRSLINAYAEDFDNAVLDAKEAVRVASCKWDHLMTGTALGHALVVQGKPEEALKVFDAIRPDVVERGVKALQGVIDAAYGVALAESDAVDDGLAWFEDAITHFTELGNRRVVAGLHLNIGEMLLILSGAEMRISRSPYWRRVKPVDDSREGLMVGSLEHLNRAVEIGEEVGMQGIVASALLGLASLHREAGDEGASWRSIQQARDLVKELGWPALERRVKDAVAQYKTGDPKTKP